MTSDARYAQAARARQGGFSTHQLPAPALYAGTPPSAGTGGWLLAPTTGFSSEGLIVINSTKPEDAQATARNSNPMTLIENGPDGNAALETSNYNDYVYSEVWFLSCAEGPIRAYDGTDFEATTYELSDLQAYTADELTPLWTGAELATSCHEYMIRLGEDSFPAVQSDPDSENIYVSEITYELKLTKPGDPMAAAVLLENPNVVIEVKFYKSNDAFDVEYVDNYEPGQWQLAWYIAASNAAGSSVSVSDSNNYNLSENQYHHLAIQLTPSSISLYFRGSRVANLNISSISPVVPTNGSIVHSRIDLENYTYNESGNLDVGRCAIQGYRFTAGQNLYSGATITPPTSITTLA